MNELMEKDKSFSEAMFITKVNNMFIMLCTAIMTNDLNRVKHYISDELEKRYEKKLNILNENNERQMYDELNTKETYIQSIKVEDDKAIVDVVLLARYMDYIVNKETGTFKRGNNSSRTIKKYNLRLVKKMDGYTHGNVIKCYNCGADVDVNNSGVCPYCRSVFNEEKHDWVIESIN